MLSFPAIIVSLYAAQKIKKKHNTPIFRLLKYEELNSQIGIAIKFLVFSTVFNSKNKKGKKKKLFNAKKKKKRRRVCDLFEWLVGGRRLLASGGNVVAGNTRNDPALNSQRKGIERVIVGILQIVWLSRGRAIYRQFIKSEQIEFLD